jgi:hypothetical protein
MACKPEEFMFMQACAENDLARVKDILGKHKDVKLTGGLRIALLNEYIEIIRAILDTRKISQLDIIDQLSDIIRKDKSFALETLTDYMKIKWSESEVLLAIDEFAIGCLLHMLAHGSYTDALLRRIFIFAAEHKVHLLTQYLLMTKRVKPTEYLLKKVCAKSDVETLRAYFEYSRLSVVDLVCIKKALLAENIPVVEYLMDVLRIQVDDDEVVRTHVRAIIRSVLDRLVENHKFSSVIFLLKQAHTYNLSDIFKTPSRAQVKDIAVKYCESVDGSSDVIVSLLSHYLHTYRSNMAQNEIQHLERVINQWAHKKFLLKNVVQQYLTTDLIKQLTSM